MKKGRIVMRNSASGELADNEAGMRTRGAVSNRFGMLAGKVDFTFFTGGSRHRKQLLPISRAPKRKTLSREEQIQKISRRFMRSIVRTVAKKQERSRDEMQPALFALYDFFSAYPLHQCSESMPMSERYPLATQLLREELEEQGYLYPSELDLHLPQAQLRRVIAGLPQPTRLVVAFDWDNTLYFCLSKFGIPEKLMSSLLTAVNMYLYRLQLAYLKRGVTFIILTARTPLLNRAGVESSWVRKNVPVIYTGNMVPKIKFCQDMSTARECSVILMDDNPMELQFFQQAQSSLKVDVNKGSGVPVEIQAINAGQLEADLQAFTDSLESRDASEQERSTAGAWFIENLFNKKPFKLLTFEIDRCLQRQALREVAEQKKPSPSP